MSPESKDSLLFALTLAAASASVEVAMHSSARLGLGWTELVLWLCFAVLLYSLFLTLVAWFFRRLSWSKGLVL